MSRLLVALLALACIAALVVLSGLVLRASVARGIRGVEQAELGDGTVKKMSFALLLGLILYVALWGGG